MTTVVIANVPAESLKEWRNGLFNIMGDGGGMLNYSTIGLPDRKLIFYVNLIPAPSSLGLLSRLRLQALA